MSSPSPLEYEQRIRALERINATLAAEVDRMRPVVEAVDYWDRTNYLTSDGLGTIRHAYAVYKAGVVISGPVGMEMQACRATRERLYPDGCGLVETEWFAAGWLARSERKLEHDPALEFGPKFIRRAWEKFAGLAPQHATSDGLRLFALGVQGGCKARDSMTDSVRRLAIASYTTDGFDYPSTCLVSGWYAVMSHEYGENE